MESDGYVVRTTEDGRGLGVFAIRTFSAGDTVVVGIIERRVERNHSHATQVGRCEYVELSGAGPKVNHSCDPNCGIRVNDRGAPDLIARRRIAAGEEVTFDYAMRNHSIEHFPSRCRCGTELCRGFVTGWKDLPGERKTEYRSIAAPYLLQMEDETGSTAVRF